MQRGISTHSDDADAQQCCLRAAHVFLLSLLLLLVCGTVLVLSYSQLKDTLQAARTPCVAVLILAAVIAAASGSLAAFVEMRLQDRWRVCRLLYFLQCYACMDEDESRLLRDEVLSGVICAEPPEERPLPSKQPFGYTLRLDSPQTQLTLHD